MKVMTKVLITTLLLAGGFPARAYYRTITVTGYYSIAVDGEFVWGGSTGMHEGYSGPAQEPYLWRYRPIDGTCETWTLKEITGMKGEAAFIVPLPDQVLVGISGSDWSAEGRGKGVPAPDRLKDGGLIRFDRTTKKWSVLEIPLYDAQYFQLLADDLWITCGDKPNLRNDILVGVSRTNEFVDVTAPTGKLAYAVVASEGAYGKGGLLGEMSNAAPVNHTGGTNIVTTGERPERVRWGLGEMIYVKPLDLYVDEFPFPNLAGEYPVTCATQPQAKALAALQGKRLPTNAEYLGLLPAGWKEKNLQVNADMFWPMESFNCRMFEKNGALKQTQRWGGIKDIGMNVKEWLDELSPLGDGKTYGLAAGGTYPQVALPVKSYFPNAEFPAGSWARDINRFNHSEIGFRCVMSGEEMLRMLQQQPK